MKKTMKTNLLRMACLMLLLFQVQVSWAVLAPGEYYIVNDFWGKLLTVGADQSPMLKDFSASSNDAYVFVAEDSGTSGYVKLKLKSTGLYLTASPSNSWSVVFSEAGSGDHYLWSIEQRFDYKIVNKKNTNRRLGSDFYQGSGSNWTYYYSAEEVPVYYDKTQGALNWYSVIPANGNGFTSSRSAAKTGTFTNEYGVTEQDDYQVSEPVDVPAGLDYHIISSSPFSSTGNVNLSSRTSWLVFENVRPSKVISSYLNKVKIAGAAAKNGTNCRVEIWLRGAVVIPISSEAPFVATTDDGTFSVGVGNTQDLGVNSNKARSFTLKRGYMVTLATKKNGGDYSRVYVADHADLTVTLPKWLDRRVTSVYVRNWHYVGKSGYCSTKGDLLTATKACGASWAWNWDAGMTSSADVEYVPIKSHLNWPSDGNFNKAGSTAMMLFNEPEHSEQHTSSKCSCGGAINEWTSYTNTPKFNSTGLRIGSPSATDIGYISNYVDHCNNMKQRIDFVCTHGYWTSEWDSNLGWLQSIGLPVWITEWEWGASWTSGSNPNSANDARAKVFDLLEKLEYNKYVERYSYYEFDTGGSNGWMREIFYNNTYTDGLAYVGEIYNKVKTHFGYNSSIQHVPNYWAPEVKTPQITDVEISDGKYVLSMTNGNGDATATFDIMRKHEDSAWESIYSYTDRSLFENTNFTLELEHGIEAGDQLKIHVTTLFSEDAVESQIYSIPNYRPLAELRNMEFDEGANVTSNIRTYDKDKTGSETSWLNDVSGWVIPANGDARAGGRFLWGSSYFLGSSGYNCPAQNSEGTTQGGAIGIVGVWTGRAQYVQNAYLEPGSYTITIPVYNSNGGTTSIEKNLFGFIAEDGTEILSTTKTFAKNQWTTLTVNFVLNEGTYGNLSVGYVAANKGSGDMPHLFIDYVRIAYDPELPDLSALDDMQNLTFDEEPYTTKSLRPDASAIQNQDTETSGTQSVNGWTSVVNDVWRAAGQLSFGSERYVGNPTDLIPAVDSRGKDLGGALGLIAAWQAQLQYTQDVTLPAGIYDITIPVYNTSGTTGIDKNYFGFVTNGGKEYFASNTTFPVGEWTTMNIKMVLTETTAGKLSVGYKAANTTSGNMPHLFVDYFQITCGKDKWPEFLFGDVTHDGKTDEADVQALVNILMGRSQNSYDLNEADVNQDGDVTLGDITALVNQLLAQ